MMFPLLDNPRVTSSFGQRVHPVTGVLKFHNGTDYGVPNGTPIYSPDSGRVSGWMENNVGGKQMLVKHDNGFRTGYAHLNSRIKAKGSKVKKGELIGYTGQTGNVTGAHLHFTVKNPLNEYEDPESIRWSTGQLPDIDYWKILSAIGIAAGLYKVYQYIRD